VVRAAFVHSFCARCWSRSRCVLTSERGGGGPPPVFVCRLPLSFTTKTRDKKRREEKKDEKEREKQDFEKKKKKRGGPLQHDTKNHHRRNTTTSTMGISRDSLHKRRATGGKLKPWRKARKYVSF
jgi:hypothetical protein